MGEIRIERGGPLRGTVRVPGDKSISHRALLLAAIARGRCRIQNVAPGADVRSTAACLRALGVVLSQAGDVAEVEGGPLADPGHALDCGNSGTTARLLAAVLTGSGAGGTLSGDASLSRRPMARVVEPLRTMGAAIECAPGGRLPLVVAPGRPLHGAAHELAVASAQVKSALLVAGLQAHGETSVHEPLPSRDHTERMLPSFGATLERRGGALVVHGPAALHAPASLSIPGDLSSAAFLVAAALLVPGSDVTIEEVGLNPTRTGLLQVLARMGAALSVDVLGERSGEPAGRIRVRAGELVATDVEAAEVPGLIDEIPVLAAIGTQASGTTTIRGASELRVKESDRIARIAAGLSALGARVRELPDGLSIDGPTRLSGAHLDGSPDHRLVLTFCVAALAATGPSTVEGAGWADVSYPGFTAALTSLGASVSVR